MSQEPQSTELPDDVFEAVARIVREQTTEDEHPSGSLKAEALVVHQRPDGETVVISSRLRNLRLNWKRAVSTVLCNGTPVVTSDNELVIVLYLLRALNDLHESTKVELGEFQAKVVLFVWKATEQQGSVSAVEIAKAIGLDQPQLEATLGVLSLLGAIKQHDDGRVEMADTIRFVGIPSA